jgi:hypothetical protein
MDHAMTSHPRRSSRPFVAVRAVALATFAAALAACSDAPSTAPASPTRLSTGLSAYAAFTKGSKSPTAQVDTFVYDGRAKSFPFGDGHKVDFDANSVCDPATSGYGPGTWDRSCTPAQGRITFVVTSWRDADGRAQMSFSPDVRFVPNTSEMLSLNDKPGKAKKATVLWCSPLLAEGCIDETLGDPTLATKISSGRVTRRIKHFSGYNVVFGFDGGEAGQ